MRLDGRILAPVFVAAMLLLSGCSVLGGGGSTPTAGTTPTETATGTAAANATQTTGNATGTATATATRSATGTPTPTPTPVPTPTKVSETGIRVSEIVADPDGKDRNNLNAEYIVLKNTGDNPVDLTGWRVKDEDGHVYTFQNELKLLVGETVTLHSGQGSQSDSDRYWWSDEPIWDNGGETITIFDETGQQVFKRTYE